MTDAPRPVMRIGGDDVVLFASDLHLGDHDPATARFFLDALAEHARDATHVVLLGDLFEAWIGDDAPDHEARALLDALGALAARGVGVYAMRGNRDFLLGRAPEAARANALGERGVTLLDDPTLVDLHGERVLLSHGDAWCTDDRDYQAFRATTRSDAWQRDFLARPLDERQGIARSLRGESELAKGAKPPAWMDVNARACAEAVAAAHATSVIHGHTHRPAHHRDGVSRWVLPDWDAAAGRGGFLRVDARGARRVGPWADTDATGRSAGAVAAGRAQPTRARRR